MFVGILNLCEKIAIWIQCFVHKLEKTTVYLNFDNGKNINVQLEQEKLKEYIYCLLPKKSGWLLSSPREYKLTGKSIFYKFENIVEFQFKEGSYCCVEA